MGDRGEQIAADHLTGLGWRVLDRNWRCRDGEIDIVAEAADGALLFCEVKTRRSLRCGAPVEGVTPDKARRLRVLAWAWLAAHHRRPPSFRIDVIGVLCPPSGGVEVQHLEAVA